MSYMRSVASSASLALRSTTICIHRISKSTLIEHMSSLLRAFRTQARRPSSSHTEVKGSTDTLITVLKEPNAIESDRIDYVIDVRYEGTKQNHGLLY